MKEFGYLNCRDGMSPEEKFPNFEGTYCLHLQGQTVKEEYSFYYSWTDFKKKAIWSFDMTRSFRIMTASQSGRHPASTTQLRTPQILTLEGPCIIFCNIYTFQRDTQCSCTDCLLILRCELYMFRTVTVHPQELVQRLRKNFLKRCTSGTYQHIP